MAQPKTVDGLLEEATSALETSDLERALWLLRLAWALAPAEPRLPAAMSTCLRRLNRHQEAKWLVQQQLDLEPEAMPLLLAEVEAAIEAGQVQQALRFLLLLEASGDTGVLNPILNRLAEQLLPADHTAGSCGSAELLQALLPVFPRQLLLLDGPLDEAIEAVATQLDAPGWQRLHPPGPLTAAHELAKALASQCGAAPVVMINLSRCSTPASLWRVLAQQRGVKLAMLLVVTHPLQIVQCQRRRGISAQASLQQWLHWAERGAQTIESCAVLPYDTRRSPSQTGPTLPWIDGDPPEPEVLLLALEMHQTLLNAQCAVEPRENPATATTVVQWLVDAATREQCQGEPRWAEWLLRVGLELQPQQQGLYPALARCLRQQNRADEAERVVRQHLLNDPTSAPGWIGLAELERERGRWQAAINHYGTALALDPTHGGLPRALRHTADHLLGNADPRLDVTPEELLELLRPGLPQSLQIVFDPLPGRTTKLRHLANAYDHLLQTMTPGVDTQSRLVLAPTADRIDMLLAALQADCGAIDGHQSTVLLVDERQICFSSLWESIISSRGLDQVVVVVNHHPSCCMGIVSQSQGLQIQQVLCHWLYHMLEIERVTRSSPRIRVNGHQLYPIQCGETISNELCDILKKIDWPKSSPIGLHAECMNPRVKEAYGLSLAMYAAMNESDEAVCIACVDHIREQFDLFRLNISDLEYVSWQLFFRESPACQLLRRHLGSLLQETKALTVVSLSLVSAAESNVDDLLQSFDLNLLNGDYEMVCSIDHLYTQLQAKMQQLSLLIKRHASMEVQVDMPADEIVNVTNRLLRLWLSVVVLPISKDGWVDLLSTNFVENLVAKSSEHQGTDWMSANIKESIYCFMHSSASAYAAVAPPWLEHLIASLKPGNLHDFNRYCTNNTSETSLQHASLHASVCKQLGSKQLIQLLRCEVDQNVAAVLRGADTVAVLDFQDHWNAGDSAIWLGQLATLRRIGVSIAYQCSAHDYDPVLLKRKIGNQPILLSGGGNLGDLWLLHQLLRERVIHDFPENPIIQLPQSICFQDEQRRVYFKNLIDSHYDFTLMTRDQASYVFAKDQLGAKVLLSPDMAFGMDPHLMQNWVFRQEIANVLWLRRTDKESQHLSVQVPKDWLVCDWLEQQPFDDQHEWNTASALTSRISHLKWGLLERDSADTALVKLSQAYEQLAELRLKRGIAVLSTAHVIVTDRLHAHILTLFLDRPSIIMDNSYKKLRGAFSAWTSLASQSYWVECEEEALTLAHQLSELSQRSTSIV